MDRRFNRRGWATFERTVNIREICWALNSVKVCITLNFDYDILLSLFTINIQFIRFVVVKLVQL